MYNRYIRGQSGHYIRQSVPEPAHEAAAPAQAVPPPPRPQNPSPPIPPQTNPPENPPPQNERPQPPRRPPAPGSFGPGRQLEADDLLIAAILALLLRDGEELDWTSLLAGFLYLFL